MSERPFMSTATINRVKTDLRRRAFATKVALQDPLRVLTFVRSGGVTFTADDILVSWANREAAGEGSPTVTVIGTEGELQRWQALPLATGDRFTIDGHMAEITGPSIVDDGVARAGFRLTSGG